MKNILFSMVASLLLLMQSCTVNTDVVLHKDSSSSLQLDAEFKELMDVVKQQGGADADMKGLEKLPKAWTSMYDLEINDGGKITDKDSIRLMKKMFMKGNFMINELTGMSIRLDRFTQQDYQTIEKMNRDNSEDKLPVDGKMFMNWDGKKIVLNTKDFSLSNMEEMMAKGTSEDDESPIDPEQTKQMMQMMIKKMTYNLKFENDIKSITGKHDWVKQIDKRTVQVNFDVANFDLATKLTHNDPQITIITE